MPSPPQEPTLFSSQVEEPLAARMRPRTLDEFIGQEHIVGEGRLLRRAIHIDQLSSLIFSGPPGTGKTTLARVIANTTKSSFCSLNAVLAGVKDIRAAIDEAQALRREGGRRTILFVDEVHRWNKSQQDALLPWVENGTVVLIGATTENPFFSVNSALVSRSRVFQLKPLTDDDMHRVLKAAMEDPERGYGRRSVHLDPDAADHLVRVADGDARSLLNALELAVETSSSHAGDIRIDLSVAEESIQRRAVLYDSDGDYHFDTISAFIKSIRGSDPDAALYWLARMIAAGEDPRFLFRRMIISAAEDVGMADPQALVVAHTAAAAFDRIGMPEGRLILSQTAIYLATAPKSNTALALFDAMRTVEEERQAEVPNHLRDASRDAQDLGHGAGYLYPHAYRDHWVAQRYLPEALADRVFYSPSDQGYEGRLADLVRRRRDLVEAAETDPGPFAGGENLTANPADSAGSRWTKRVLSGAGEILRQIRDALVEDWSPPRHARLLAVDLAEGLLPWELRRMAPEGLVACVLPAGRAAEGALRRAAELPELERPLLEVAETLFAVATAVERIGDPGMSFEGALVRNVAVAGAGDALGTISARLAPGAPIRAAESLYGLAESPGRILRAAAPRESATLIDRLEAAEAAFMAKDPRCAWSTEELRGVYGARFDQVRVTEYRVRSAYAPSQRELETLFALGEAPPAAGSYGEAMTAALSVNDRRRLAGLLSEITRREVRRETAFAVVEARNGRPEDPSRGADQRDGSATTKP